MEALVLVIIVVGVWWYLRQNSGKQHHDQDQEYFDHRLATYGISPDLIPKSGRVQITLHVRDHVQYGRKHGVYEGGVSMGGERYEHWFLDDAAKLTAYILSLNQAEPNFLSDKSKWHTHESTAAWLLPILDEHAVPYDFDPPWEHDDDTK